MSKKIEEIEKEILSLEYRKSEMELSKGFITNTNVYGDETRDSLSSKIKAREKERQFELEKQNRDYSKKIYNQAWFHVLVTAVVTLIATLLAS